MIAVLLVQPGSGCWRSSVVVFDMTGLINSASAEGSALAPHLCDHAAVAEHECIAEARPSPLADSQPDPEAWRREVAARLARYRTRRKPRAPRYPSLLLPFDTHEDRHRSSAVAAAMAPASSEPGVDNIPVEDARVVIPVPVEKTGEEFQRYSKEGQFENIANPQAAPPPEVSAKIIEFPRSAAIPIADTDQLADPILDRPRIVEAPEIVPPAPALGGILIEPAQTEVVDRFARTETLISLASIASRLLATSIDAVILAAALSGFSVIFLRVNPIQGSFGLLAGAGAAIAILLWITYECFFVICTGSTPGLRAAGLRVRNFDGSPVSQSTRRWRVLASFLSAFSVGLGYLWCFLDQDSLCWHDRITRTYIQVTTRSQ